MNTIHRSRFVLGSYHYLRFPLDCFLDTAQSLGLDWVELWAAAPHFCLDTLTPERLAETKRLLRARGLKVWCLTPEQVNYPVNLAAEEPELRAHSVRNFKRAIEAAQALECAHILTTAGCGYYNHSAADAWERSRESLAELEAYAKPRGVELWLETLTPMSSNVLNTPAQQREMIAQLPLGNTRPILDIGQMAYMEQSLDDYLAHGPSLAHVHLHDSHPGIHIALGDGDLPIADYLTRLEEAGYQGRYAFECNDARYRFDPAACDRQNMAWLESHGLVEG